MEPADSAKVPSDTPPEELSLLARQILCAMLIARNSKKARHDGGVQPSEIWNIFRQPRRWQHLPEQDRPSRASTADFNRARDKLVDLKIIEITDTGKFGIKPLRFTEEGGQQALAVAQEMQVDVSVRLPKEPTGDATDTTPPKKTAAGKTGSRKPAGANHISPPDSLVVTEAPITVRSFKSLLESDLLEEAFIRLSGGAKRPYRTKVLEALATQSHLIFSVLSTPIKGEDGLISPVGGFTARELTSLSAKANHDQPVFELVLQFLEAKKYIHKQGNKYTLAPFGAELQTSMDRHFSDQGMPYDTCDEIISDIARRNPDGDFSAKSEFMLAALSAVHQVAKSDPEQSKGGISLNMIFLKTHMKGFLSQSHAYVLNGRQTITRVRSVNPEAVHMTASALCDSVDEIRTGPGFGIIFNFSPAVVEAAEFMEKCRQNEIAVENPLAQRFEPALKPPPRSNITTQRDGDGSGGWQNTVKWGPPDGGWGRG